MQSLRRSDNDAKGTWSQYEQRYKHNYTKLKRSIRQSLYIVGNTVRSAFQQLENMWDKVRIYVRQQRMDNNAVSMTKYELDISSLAHERLATSKIDIGWWNMVKAD